MKKYLNIIDSLIEPLHLTCPTVYDVFKHYSLDGWIFWSASQRSKGHRAD